ncbi:ABC transporter substrate-binding protein [Pseudoroseomonas wenyumeiae]|uniref:ABC transporter substrate-binding protein n=1 Tax=Teichococcus wenyumeiae TaxID=2478470 RepID=A0A3A9JA65_9PROT|nr:ABC transporter substrate-binding protein [Pseudoroseomonas wenyumeiae]RKK03332.1 ABC transporter substrate-binding protein [Pseudoroseomonas wenyumeiae]RMI24543.1 ABC transporter substrate-binding protein [Pseudoroseomonas wenyumeiae]
MQVTRRLLLGASGALAMPGLLRAQGTGPIRIGEINSYTTMPAFTLPYRNAMQLAVETLNGQGGVLGRQLELLTRDDAGKPQDAVRLAGELVNDQKVDVLAGAYFSNVGLALSEYAAQNRRLYVGGEPLTDAMVWERGNRYTFRLRPSTYMQAAILAEEAAKLPAKRWVTVAPNYEFGQSGVKWFKQLLSARRPDVQFVGEQWPALGRVDAGATVQALEQMKPDAIFNVLFGPDLTNFVRQGNTRGLFEGRAVVSLLTGEPEYLDPLGDEAPEGWIVTGYPGEQIDTPAHKAFVDAYRGRFNAKPMCGSLVGYALIQSIAAGIARAESTSMERMVEGFRGAGFESPVGPVTYREIDQQGTLGVFVGRTGLKNDAGIMVDWRYIDGRDLLPGDDFVRKLRPA